MRNSHNIPPTPEISSFPFSLCHCQATHLSASDSFTTMALYKNVLTYLLTFHVHTFIVTLPREAMKQQIPCYTSKFCTSAKPSRRKPYVMEVVYWRTTQETSAKSAALFHQLLKVLSCCGECLSILMPYLSITPAYLGYTLRMRTLFRG